MSLSGLYLTHSIFCGMGFRIRKIFLHLENTWKSINIMEFYFGWNVETPWQIYYFKAFQDEVLCLIADKFLKLMLHLLGCHNTGWTENYDVNFSRQRKQRNLHKTIKDTQNLSPTQGKVCSSTDLPMLWF